MKRTMKQLSALLLAAMMLLGVLTGCGSKDAPASNNADQASGNEQAAKQPKDDEVITLKVWGFGYSTTSEDMALVSEAASKITREKLGFDVEIVRYSDSEKLNLAMNSGEAWDLVSYHTYSGGLPALVNNGMALPIDDLAAQYGQDALAAVGEEMLNAGRMNGVLYSIPSIDVWANGYGLAIRTDILEEADIDPAALKTWDDLHEACLKIKELHPDKYIVTAWQGGGMQKTFAWLPNAYIFATLLCFAFDSVEYESHMRLEGMLGCAVIHAFDALVSAPFAGGFESGILRLGFVDVEGIIPSVEVTNFMTMSFYLFDTILAVVVIVLLPFVDVEKQLPKINAELLRRKKEAVLARGEEWIDPAELERIEAEKAAVIREENRIADLKARCAKKGLDFDVENEKYLAKLAKKNAKKSKVK